MAFYQQLLQLTRGFFLKTNHIFICRQLGIWLYKLSLKITIKILTKKLPGIKAVYNATNFGKNFLVGESDIDLFIISADKTIEQEVEFIKKFKQVNQKITKWFPFLYLENFFLTEAKKWDQVCRPFIAKDEHKHWNGLNLIYGQEIRNNYENNEQEISSYDLRVWYEQILVNIYQSKINEKKYFRMLYNHTLYIIRSFFIIKNKRDAINIEEYKNFLGQIGISNNFCQTFFKLPKKKFKVNNDFEILTLFSIIKVIELMGQFDQIKKENDLNIVRNTSDDINQSAEIKGFIDDFEKTAIKSIYLTKSPLGFDSKYIYLIFKDNLDYATFKEQIKYIINSIPILKTLGKKIQLGYRPFMYVTPPDIFPIIITKKMTNYSKFINGGSFFENANLKMNGKKLFGDNQTVDIDIQEMKKYSYFINLSSPHLDLRDILITNHAMIYKLLNKKNILCLNNIHQEYEKNFGRINYDLNTPEQRYVFARKLIRENNDLN